jgi:hypothetical protein
MNWKGFSRMWWWSRYYLSVCLGEVRKATKSLSAQQYRGPRFEHGTFRIRVWRATAMPTCSVVAQSVSIATAYGLDDRGSVPGRGKIFLYSTASRPTLGPTQPPSQWVSGGVSPGVKRQGREASPPSRAKVKNCEAIPPLPTRVHDVVLN